ncbi:hypothetical protein BJY00DRAFT_93541 [Aspergillus carlsbadensis]|nr:hypothetical protein BJY00DRAFT_93541 [Aspergillus carlsbadensis]
MEPVLRCTFNRLAVPGVRSPRQSIFCLFRSFFFPALAYRYDAAACVPINLPSATSQNHGQTIQDILESQRPRRHGFSAERYISSTSPDILPVSRRAVCSGYCHPFTIREGAVAYRPVSYWSRCEFSRGKKRRNEEKPFKAHKRLHFPFFVSNHFLLQC